MVKYFITILLLSISLSVSAEEWFNGVFYVSNVCSNRFGWWVYPRSWAMPVGSACRMPNGDPGIVGG